MSTVTCLNCGWVHFERSRKEAEVEAANFNNYYDSLPEQQQRDHYGGNRASVVNYEHCFRCGGTYKNFRDSLPGDCPDGCTIQPIIKRSD